LFHGSIADPFQPLPILPTGRRAAGRLPLARGGAENSNNETILTMEQSFIF